MTETGTPASDRRPSTSGAFVQPVRLDRLEQPDRIAGRPGDAGPRWNAQFQLVAIALAVELAMLDAVTTYEVIHRIWTGAGWMLGGSVVYALGVAEEVAFIGLLAVGVAWLVVIGRRLRRIGRAGWQLRSPSVVAFMVMPLVLCATNMFANDAGRDGLDRPEANFTQYAITAGVLRLLLCVLVIRLAVGVRRSTDRLMSQG